MTYSIANQQSILPWQSPAWELMRAARQRDRLAHALLFVGASGMGQWVFAECLAAAVLCQAPDAEGRACSMCHACHLVQAKTHPDFVLLEPEQEGQMIKIDQVRAVVKCVQETAMQGGFRVVIINTAHAMNHHSANALLKTLEEPTPNCLLILISDQHTRLPATITSRCQQLAFKKPAPRVATEWLREQCDPSVYSDETIELLLALADGAPLKALSLANSDMLTFRREWYQGLLMLSQGRADPLQLAAGWHDKEWLLMLSLLLSWLRDLLRLKATDGQTSIINRDYRAALTGFAPSLTNEKLLHFIEHVQVIYAKIVNLQNLNRQLLLEELLIRWTHMYVPG